MKRTLLFLLVLLASGLSIFTIKAKAALPNPWNLIESGTWHCADDSSGDGGPWSPQPVILRANNNGPDNSITLDIFGADGSLVSSQLLQPTMTNYNVPAGGTVTVWDDDWEDQLGATGSYMVLQ